MVAEATRIDLSELVREDRVHSRIYTDPQIFELELEKIWYRSWVYVAHESEIAEPGDYKATTIGLQPVIVTRDADDGRIHVLLNRCRHRAATV
ncbi:MAG TPA: Rieske 2Fe-2S domain-containing protein, partial [Chthonomonadales bacterium]|nr:Rieske 2Fe-2S domain-containing protein [Chthonomonadales bacterium]